MNLRRFLCLGIAATLAGCASIDKFTVSTFVACAGETVTADWVARGGDVTLTTTPPLRGQGPQDAQGTRRFAVDQDTTLLLEVRGLLNTDRGENKIIVRPQVQWVGGAATCTGQPLAVEFSGEISTATASPDRRAISVKNAYTRSIVVIKDGVVAEMGPGGETDRFRNTAVVGVWTIRAPLGAGESCDVARESVANRLVVKMQMNCRD